jgi:ABC-type transport system involved in Fe-S cluster assembly fused permease/ATPase subunit
MSIELDRFVTLAIVLAIQCTIISDVMETIVFIVHKTDGCFSGTCIACVTLFLCTLKICSTWLKTLIIMVNDSDKDTRLDMPIRIIKSFGQMKSQDKENKEESQSPTQEEEQKSKTTKEEKEKNEEKKDCE